MKRKKLIILAILIVALISAAFVYNYVFNGEHRNIAEEEVSIQIAAEEIFAEFQADETIATSKYLDKVVAITGEISLVETSALSLNDIIQVSFIEGTMPDVKLKNTVTVKGRCVGYDELLEMVKIDQASVITNIN
ncbi:OB-fold protein [Winogradskyella tangerina]|uniref:OB-fold protein n=1 Tax=Winogradskyella tangerina TaxID=2023240 RepID=UPI000DBE1DED|nr:hypothetical protein [Winogradskyella tangerina]